MPYFHFFFFFRDHTLLLDRSPISSILFHFFSSQSPRSLPNFSPSPFPPYTIVMLILFFLDFFFFIPKLGSTKLRLRSRRSLTSKAFSSRTLTSRSTPRRGSSPAFRRRSTRCSRTATAGKCAPSCSSSSSSSLSLRLLTMCEAAPRDGNGDYFFYFPFQSHSLSLLAHTSNTNLR